MTQKQIQEAIKKYQMSLAEKDGRDAIRVGKPSKSAKIMEGLKAAKDDIIAELKRQQDERKARYALIEAENEKKAQEYLASADLRRCLVYYQGEYGDVEHYICTLEYTEKGSFGGPQMYQPKMGGAEVYRRVSLEHVTTGMREIMAGDAITYGLGGAAWEITPEQEAFLIAEQKPAAAEAERIGKAQAEEKTAKESAKAAHLKTERQARFDEAKATGKPVLLRKWMETCRDPREECNTDIHYEYAMPDGTTRHDWNHTW